MGYCKKAKVGNKKCEIKLVILQHTQIHNNADGPACSSKHHLYSKHCCVTMKQPMLYLYGWLRVLQAMIEGPRGAPRLTAAWRWSGTCEADWQSCCTLKQGRYCRGLQRRKRWNSAAVTPGRWKAPYERETRQHRLSSLWGDTITNNIRNILLLVKVKQWVQYLAQNDSKQIKLFRKTRIHTELVMIYYLMTVFYLQQKAGKQDFSWSCHSGPGSAGGWRTRESPIAFPLSAQSVTRE